MIRLVAALLLHGSPADARLAERLEAALRRESAAVTTRRVGDSIEVRVVDGGSVVVGLDSLKLECSSRPERCDASIERAARTVVTSLGPRQAVTRELLRACLKGPEWLQASREKVGDVLVTRPWLSELKVVYMVDLPDSVQILRRDRLTELGLKEEQLEKVALGNLDGVLPKPTLQPIGGYDGIFAIYEGDDYCTSQLLFPGRFALLAKQLGGALIVAAPVRNALIVTGRKDAKTLSELRELAAQTARTQPHALTTQLFEWSPQGFKPLPR